MNKPLLSVSQWKALLLAFCLCSAGLNLWSNVYWQRFFLLGMSGTLPMELGALDRDYHYPIRTLAPQSELARAGAKPGDTLVFDRPGDASRAMATGEAIGVVWYSSGQPHHATVTAIADSYFISAPRTVQINYVMDVLTSWGLMLLALLIGLRQAHDSPTRVFAMMLVINSTNLHTSLPGGVVQSFMAQTEFPLELFAVYATFTYFAFTFTPELACWRKAWARKLFRIYMVLFALVAAALIAENNGLLPWWFREHLAPARGKQLMSVISVALSLMALWLSWRRATGTNRQRLTWVGICTGAIFGSYFAYNLGLLLDIPIISLESNYSYMAGGRLLGFVALAYALLRHRLFDFGFAINRALAVTIISGLLLIAFAVTEFAVDKLLTFEGREKNVIFDAGVALAIILCFHRIQHWVDHQVNHTFFHHWYEAAEKLRQFLSKTVHVTESKALRSKYASALGEFSGASGIAIFLEREGVGMELCHATLPNAPAVIDANHDVVIDLRHTRQLVRLDDGARDLPGDLALPMVTQGRLRGLVLMGAKPEQQQYRPDELALLATAVRQLGMDLDSIHAAELEQAYAALQRETSLLRQLIHADRATTAIG